MSIAEKIASIRKTLPPQVTLIAVTKTKPAGIILEAYNTGHRNFGENRVQELTEKSEQLPKDISWHLIGHLQTNKVKYVSPFVSLIHSVDSLKLLEEINRQAAKHKRTIDVLLQIFIAREETKFGMEENEAESLLRSDFFQSLKHVRVRGLMGMASNTEDKNLVRKEFRGLYQFFERLKSEIGNPEFEILSMGMSSDYQIAIEEGSTMIRLGSSIFGER